jgi:hypothetical protein
MRVEGWNPSVLDDLVNEAMPERLREAAEYLAATVRPKVPVGTVSRPIYRRGRSAGQFWTARDAGELRRSVRVVRRHGKSGRILLQAKNIRVYVGHAKAWYAAIVEYQTPYLRPAFYAALDGMRRILGAT